MDPLLSILLTVLIFVVVAYGLYWVCTKFQMPQPILWLCRAILLIIILMWATGHVSLPMMVPAKK